MDMAEVKEARRQLESELTELMNLKLLAFQDRYGVAVTGFKVQTTRLQRLGFDDCVFVSEVQVEARV